MITLRKLAIFLIFMTGLAAAADHAERKVVHREDPEYPQIAKNMNLHGTVRLKLWIKPDGTVRRTEYIGGHPVLAESALKTVKNWTYQTSDKESTEVVELKF